MSKGLQCFHRHCAGTPKRAHFSSWTCPYLLNEVQVDWDSSLSELSLASDGSDVCTINTDKGKTVNVGRAPRCSGDVKDVISQYPTGGASKGKTHSLPLQSLENRDAVHSNNSKHRNAASLCSSMTEVMSTNPASDPMLSPKATDSAPDLSKSSLPNPQLHRRRRSWTRSSSGSRSRSRSCGRRRYRRSRSPDYSRSSRNLHFSRNGRLPYGRSPPPRSRLSGRPRDRSPRRHSSRSPSHHRYQSGPRSGNRFAVAPPNAGDRWPDGSSGGGGPLDYPEHRRIATAPPPTIPSLVKNHPVPQCPL
ncbi:hypothetical protein SprV_0200890300 [Sparganum proliferum]